MKKLNDITIDLKYAKKLDELGVKIDSLLVHTKTLISKKWVVFEWKYFVKFHNKEKEKYYPAYTTDELLEILPDLEEDILTLWRDHGEYYISNVQEGCTNDRQSDEKSCNALAKMLIYLLENKLMELPK